MNHMFNQGYMNVGFVSYQTSVYSETMTYGLQNSYLGT